MGRHAMDADRLSSCGGHMPDASLTIHHLIIHKVDHKNSMAPVFTDLPIHMTESVHAFFARQINDSRNNKYARSGAFLPTAQGEPSVPDVCADLVTDVDTFIEQSKVLTARLFDSMKPNKRISIGDLVILTFTDPHDLSPSVAILKMDEQSGLVEDIIETGGKRQAVLRPALGVLMNSDLQKCAFVLPKDRRTARRDLIVLDQQAARFGTRRSAASFFVTTFLQATLSVDPRIMTETFYRESRNWLVDKQSEISPQEIDTLKARVQSALSQVLIDVDVIASDTLADLHMQDDYASYLREKFLEQDFGDLVFPPDPTFKPKQQYLYFTGDNGLKIRVLEDAFGSGKTFYYQVDSATGRIDVEVNTSTLTRQ